MFDLIYVTNRHLSQNFLDDIGFVLETKKPNFILLREKDLSRLEYNKLAKDVLEITKNFNTELILHTHFETALAMNIANVHFTFLDFKKYRKYIPNFKKVGVSIHSLDELYEVQKYNVDYVIVGHIFKTQSHHNETPKGIEFLESICRNSQVKVYAIGGIDFRNVHLIRNIGANGACMMRAMLD